MLCPQGELLSAIEVQTAPLRLLPKVGLLGNRARMSPWGLIEKQNGNVQVNLPPAGWVRLAFGFRNAGSAALVHPIYNFVAVPDNVFIDQADFRLAERANHNRFQISGANVTDVLPHSQSRSDHNISVDVTVPAGASNFELVFRAVGENMDGAREFRLHLAVARQQQ